MTTTVSVNGQSIGTGANVGYGLFPQKVTIAATTTAFNLAVRVTNPATSSYDIKRQLTIYWASSPFSLSAAAAVDALKHAARQKDIRNLREASAVAADNTEVESVLGSYIYFWFDCPTHTVAQTLDCSCVELP